ncbi:hypothetical protein ACFOW1_01705 [Parasediminibacterium paludis]|uniref:Uncharacterized protein n=1 Tax=Parasediminibacterium paludis TaxID=908966 RepID=A0ABV8PUL9_9BACT
MATLQEQVTALTAANADLQVKLDAANVEIDTLTKVNENLQEQVITLSQAAPKAAAEIAKPQVSKETFVVDGKKYGFHPSTPAVLFDGQKITATEVLASQDLQKALIEAEASFIQLLD